MTNEIIRKIVELSTTGQLREYEKEYSSFTLIHEVLSKNVAKKKFSKLVSGINTHIWLDKKLTSRYENENKITNICHNSKLVITNNKTMTLKTSNHWDTYFVSRQLDIKHLKNPEVIINGIKIPKSNTRITNLDNIRAHMGWIPLTKKSEPKCYKGLLMVYLSVLRQSNTEPISIKMRNMLVILNNQQIMSILLDKVTKDKRISKYITEQTKV